MLFEVLQVQPKLHSYSCDFLEMAGHLVLLHFTKHTMQFQITWCNFKLPGAISITWCNFKLPGVISMTWCNFRFLSLLVYEI